MVNGWKCLLFLIFYWYWCSSSGVFVWFFGGGWLWIALPLDDLSISSISNISLFCLEAIFTVHFDGSFRLMAWDWLNMSCCYIVVIQFCNSSSTNWMVGILLETIWLWSEGFLSYCSVDPFWLGHHHTRLDLHCGVYILLCDHFGLMWQIWHAWSLFQICGTNHCKSLRLHLVRHCQYDIVTVAMWHQGVLLYCKR